MAAILPPRATGGAAITVDAAVSHEVGRERPRRARIVVREAV
jgi:hypothetical protein